MADKGGPDDGPSLEMPSLSFGRRKHRERADEVPTIAPAPSEPVPSAPEPAQSTARPARSAPATPPSALDVSREPIPRRRPSLPAPSLPALTGIAAALATGAVVGALGVLLVWLASVGCEAARGTASCGGGPGFLVLVAVLALLAYVGTLALRAFGVRDAGSTSLLAVGVMAVLLLVLFTDALFEWWMAIVVPVVSAVAYALAWWVSTRAVPVERES